MDLASSSDLHSMPTLGIDSQESPCTRGLTRFSSCMLCGRRYSWCAKFSVEAACFGIGSLNFMAMMFSDSLFSKLSKEQQDIAWVTMPIIAVVTTAGFIFNRFIYAYQPRHI